MDSRPEHEQSQGVVVVSRRRFLRRAVGAVAVTGSIKGMAEAVVVPVEPDASVWDGAILPPPRQKGGRPLLETLRRRSSQRAFSPRPLPIEVISDLLWSAFGVNRPASGQRTAPSTMDRRAIELIVVTEAGASSYEAESHRLRLMVREDVRGLTGGQDYVRQAPISLLYVVDHGKQQGMAPAERTFYAAADTGFIGQNVYLFCASEGLATVVHVVPERGGLAKALGLSAEQEIVLGQCVGFPLEPSG